MSPNFYGWNPNSRNLTIPDDGWTGTKWNLPEIGKSPYTIPLMAPLFANQNINLGGIYNHGNTFPVYPNQGGDFYSGLLNAQANQGGGMVAGQSGGMTQLLELIKALIEMNKAGETDETDGTEESGTLGVKEEEAGSSDAGSSEVSADESSASDEKEINFKANKPLKGLRNFVKNTNDKTTYKLDDFETFKKETYKDLEDKSLAKVLGIFGISFKDMKSEQQTKVRAMVEDPQSVTEEEYAAILGKLGFKTGIYLHKNEFNENKDAFVANPKLVTKSKANVKEVVELIKNKDKKGLIEKMQGMTDAELIQTKKAFNKIQTSNKLKEDFDYWINKTLKENPRRGINVQSKESTAILDRVKNLETATNTKQIITNHVKNNDASKIAQTMTTYINQFNKTTDPLSKAHYKDLINDLIADAKNNNKLTGVIDAFNTNQAAWSKRDNTKTYNTFATTISNIGKNLKT